MDQPQLILDSLKRATIFSLLPEPQLLWLANHSQCATVEAGSSLILEGQTQDSCYLILEGEFEILKSTENRPVVITIQGQGEILGEMSMLSHTPPTATVRAAQRSQVLKISRDHFQEILTSNPTLSLELLRTVIARLRNTEAMLNQHERLASLGTLAAGLTHELNNPAAAAQRSTNLLQQALSEWLDTRKEVDALGMDPYLNEIILSRLISDTLLHDHFDAGIDPIQRSDRERDIETWLTEHGTSDAWQHAPVMVEFGWDIPTLEKWEKTFTAGKLPVILHWIAVGYTVHSLLDEISHSTRRISEIVSAVKSYAYLDEAPKKEIDIHEGLENTLIILKHKLQPGISVQREYDRNLPKIEAYASELNQVWTNLIDNAIDAMQGEGVLLLRTSLEADQVLVEVIDTGAGIPESAIKHIFEPFYTSKEPGKGTGLGLHVSYNIIRKHRGEISVQSQPGRTRFTVSLPIRVRHSPENPQSEGGAALIH